jgi:hypothetical protein
MQKEPHAKVATAAKEKQAEGVVGAKFCPPFSEGIYPGKKPTSLRAPGGLCVRPAFLNRMDPA